MKIFKVIWVAIFLILSGSLLAAPSVSVTFVMDESGSVSSSNFNLEKQGFIKALENLPQNGSVEMSAIGFSSSSQTLVNPTVLDSSTFSSVKGTLEANTQNGGTTNMTSAINSAASLLGSSSAPTKIICIATDGSPNNRTTASAAASNAKNAGITLSPVGIGLNSSGKIFLDSIASNPPIPNPSNFTEFATVVTNDCVGAVKSALNIQLTPDPVDFGSFNAGTIDEDLKICAKEPEVIGVLNYSNQPAKVTKIELTGIDADDYELVSFMGIDAATITYPILVPPQFTTQIKIKLKPNKTPADKSYDATLKLTAEDANQVSGEFTTTLIAKVDPAFPSCLGLTPIDASPLVADISATGTPLKRSSAIGPSKVPVNENDVALTIKNDKKQKLLRKGLVSDGNSRLLLVSRSRQSTGKVRFEIINPASTEMRLYPLTHAPTYKPNSKEYDDKGKIVLDLDIAADPEGFGQVTAVLRAGERFLGGDIENLKHKIKACILDPANICTESIYEQAILEYKTPILLNHGIWAMPNSFGKIGPGIDKDTDLGMYEYLVGKKYSVDFVQYDKTEKNYRDYLGPVDLATPTSPFIKTKIDKLCMTFRNQKKIACTRADIVAHSMGGMMARSFILRHGDYNSSSNFMQGSVRRLVTLGTPHIGSGLANFLWKDEDDIGNCIREEKRQLYDPPFDKFDDAFNLTGYEMVDKIIQLLNLSGKRVDTGIDNLRLGNNTFLARTDMTEQLPVPVFAVYGDIADGIFLSLEEYQYWIDKSGICNGQTGNQCVSTALEYLTGCSVADLFGNENSDGIVPINSAMWEGYIPNGTSTRRVDGIKHVGMGTNTNIMSIAETLLNSTELKHFYTSH